MVMMNDKSARHDRPDAVYRRGDKPSSLAASSTTPARVDRRGGCSIRLPEAPARSSRSSSERRQSLCRRPLRRL